MLFYVYAYVCYEYHSYYYYYYHIIILLPLKRYEVLVKVISVS